MSTTHAASASLKIAAGSIAVGLVVLAIKTLAWWMTGSVALFSDALESIVNVVAAVAALIAVYYAAQPADERHPYGHHKAEYFSAVLEGAMIIVAALSSSTRPGPPSRTRARWMRRSRGCSSTGWPASSTRCGAGC
jgi:divalent metal cation (Fe/Co/Zn/Cd) transporter